MAGGGYPGNPGYGPGGMPSYGPGMMGGPVGGGMGGAEESGLKLRSWEPDAGVQHAAMEAAEEFRIAGCGGLPVKDLAAGKKPGEHAADLVGSERD